MVLNKSRRTTIAWTMTSSPSEGGVAALGALGSGGGGAAAEVAMTTRVRDGVVMVPARACVRSAESACKDEVCIHGPAARTARSERARRPVRDASRSTALSCPYRSPSVQERPQKRANGVSKHFHDFKFSTSARTPLVPIWGRKIHVVEARTRVGIRRNALRAGRGIRAPLLICPGR